MSMCKMLGEPVLWLVSVSFPWGVQLRTTLVVRGGGVAYEDHYQVIASVFLDGVWYWFYSIGSDDAREHWGYIKFGFEDFEFPLWCHTGLQHFLDLLQEDAEGIADKDPDLSLDVKSRGSPYGLQHCTRLVGSADPGDGVFGTVSTNGDYTFHVHVL